MVSILLAVIVLELLLILAGVYLFFKNNLVKFEKPVFDVDEKPLGRPLVQEANVKYKNNGITEPLRLEFKEKLMAVFEEDRPFLNPNLKLQDIAAVLNLSKNQTSQIINQSFGLDFNSFVNYHRIEFAKTLFVKDDFDNISAIVYECGFNNTTSFYKSFKKFTGQTPKEYMLTYMD